MMYDINTISWESIFVCFLYMNAAKDMQSKWLIQYTIMLVFFLTINNINSYTYMYQSIMKKNVFCEFTSFLTLVNIG
jgi:hypothetical protein